MKDWRGVIIELCVLALIAYVVSVDHALAGTALTACAALAGTVIQRARIDALTGVSIAPPAGGGGGYIRVPPYPVPNLNMPGQSGAPPSSENTQAKPAVAQNGAQNGALDQAQPFR